MNGINRRRERISLGIIGLIIVGLACGPAGLLGQGQPSVTISEPASGTIITVGEEVDIVSTAEASSGVARVDLLVNGQVVRSDSPPEGTPSTFPLVQSWTPATTGDVTISVIAYDTDGAASEPAAVTLTVAASEGAAEPTEEAGTDETDETPEPAATDVPDVTAEGGCSLNASFVEDVTVPDGTEMAPGESFAKTWRIRNSGSCEWRDFQLVFVGGDQMSGEATVDVPALAAGSTIDVSVNLVAPDAPGTYRGNWRMQTDEGTLFGSRFYVEIVVPEPATDTPTPTDEPTPTFTPTPTEDSGPLITLATPQLTLVVPPGLLWETEGVYEQNSIGSGDTGSVTVECPSGSIVVGGGFATDPNVLIYNHSKEGNGWRVYGKNNTGSSKLVNAYAVCLANAEGVSVSEVYNQITASAGGVGHAEIACPSDSVIVSGGWATGSNGNLHVYNSSKNGNGWQVYARNTSGSGQLMNVYAMCLSGADISTVQVLKQEDVPGNDTHGVVATCPDDGFAFGGGFAGTDELTIYNTSPHIPHTDRWITYARNPTSSGNLLNSYAICVSFE